MKLGQDRYIGFLLCMASGTFIFLKADTSMITRKGWFGSWDHPFNAGLAQEEMTANSSRSPFLMQLVFKSSPPHHTA